ncbi:hypothetical protein M0R45_002251 [Rubus argutus]|uniref:Uncharacterized protein n=1 Tax=Rubus argutus TaxID=59490 RepID=A0AAW1VHZ7_RUBAR
MQPNLFSFGSNLGNPFLFNGDLSDDLETPPTASVLFLLPFLLFQGVGGGMDLSKVGEKILSSVKSARSLGLLPPASDRPKLAEVLMLCLALPKYMTRFNIPLFP